ncbi:MULTISPECIES: hypothetical protein [unclassified Streptomyces]|uniref:hypothetical protein n=1 Tax=unclassified Streptomyces TaxID=2593676 RepID=UPI001BEB5B71|nr:MULTISPECIES: hypothetical protein [unclassified Streptomyces]MBT2402896.1 hypothetical protein [Streptomyces sp. ISL-21]MBT2454847.1 hypothetical protein [Streptomyces sp. ISL-86]MBT2611998.1 hypothetical protein [Streptomyces sp. ISL-87]
MWVAHRDADKKIWLHRKQQASWNREVVVEGAMTGEPTLASHDGDLYVAYRR